MCQLGTAVSIFIVSGILICSGNSSIRWGGPKRENRTERDGTSKCYRWLAKGDLMTKTGYGYAKCLTVPGTATTAPGGTHRTLQEFQQLAGWVNWSFNVFPLLKPALSNVYMKIKGKTQSYARIFVSKAVIQDLSWFVSHVQRSDS